MKYKSPYRTAILLQEKLLKEKEHEIAVFRIEQQNLEVRLQRIKRTERQFYDMLMEQEEFTGYMIRNRVDKQSKYALEQLIRKAEERITTMKREYLEIKNRIDNIKKIDKEKEREFNKEKLKKESKKIESVMLVKKWKEANEIWKE